MFDETFYRAIFFLSLSLKKVQVDECIVYGMQKTPQNFSKVEVCFSLSIFEEKKTSLTITVQFHY